MKILGELSRLMGIVAEPADPFDPAALNDSLAVRINWSPLKQGGASFRTRRLVQVDLDRIEFRPTIGAILFGITFFGLGMVGVIIGIVMVFSQENVPVMAAIMPFLVGGVFAVVGAFMIRHFSSPTVFDGRTGFFWKGRRSPAEVMNPDEIKCFAELEDIHALQLISEFCRSDKSSYHSYELNLVLKSGDRRNVFDHGHLQTARTDAQKLAGYLQVPVWDAIRR